MGCIQFLLCLSALVITHSIHGKELCTITDVECLTKDAQTIFNNFVPGIKGLIAPSDPLYLEEIETSLPGLPYKLSNLTLTGMKQCQVTLLRINHKDLTYQYNLQCPHLVLNYHEKAKGFLGPVELDINGLFTVTFDDYILKIKSKYGKFISEKDQKLHFYLDVDHFTLETEVRGNFTCVSHSPLHSDETKSNMATAYINQHSNEVEKYIKSPTLEKFVAKFLGNLDLYLRNFLFEIQFPENINYV